MTHRPAQKQLKHTYPSGAGTAAPGVRGNGCSRLQQAQQPLHDCQLDSLYSGHPIGF